MSDLHDRARTALEGAGFDTQIPGILDALEPVLDRATETIAAYDHAMTSAADDISTLVARFRAALTTPTHRRIERGEIQP